MSFRAADSREIDPLIVWVGNLTADIAKRAMLSLVEELCVSGYIEVAVFHRNPDKGGGKTNESTCILTFAQEGLAPLAIKAIHGRRGSGQEWPGKALRARYAWVLADTPAAQNMFYEAEAANVHDGWGLPAPVLETQLTHVASTGAPLMWQPEKNAWGQNSWYAQLVVRGGVAAAAAASAATC